MWAKHVRLCSYAPLAAVFSSCAVGVSSPSSFEERTAERPQPGRPKAVKECALPMCGAPQRRGVCKEGKKKREMKVTKVT